MLYAAATPEAAISETILHDAPLVPWAQAAHAAGFDGITWMSRHYDTSQSYILFGHADRSSDVQPHPARGIVRAFASPYHLDWLTRLLAPLNITIAST